MNTNRFLVDTNIFILLFNDGLAEPLPDGEVVCSVITEMELLSFPDITPSEETLIRKMLSDMTVYDIDPAVKEEAIRLRRTSKLKLPDAIVAATATCHHAVLVTNDVEMRDVSDSECRSLAVKR